MTASTRSPRVRVVEWSSGRTSEGRPERPVSGLPENPVLFGPVMVIASGCDVVTVQRALGHASATTTLNTYGHLWPDAEDRTRAATDGLMSAAIDFAADSLRTARR